MQNEQKSTHLLYKRLFLASNSSKGGAGVGAIDLRILGRCSATSPLSRAAIVSLKSSEA